MRLIVPCVLFACTVGTAIAADDFKLEDGYKLLFNGKNLDGWQTKAAKPESLEGKTEAFDGRYKVKDGELIVDPKVKGDKYAGKRVLVTVTLKDEQQHVFWYTIKAGRVVEGGRHVKVHSAKVPAEVELHFPQLHALEPLTGGA